MAVHPEELYNREETTRLTFKEVNDLVHQYKEATDPGTKDQYRAKLLKIHHNYFMKYVALLSGTLNTFNSLDTQHFLALFLAGKPKTSYNYRIIALQLSQILRYYEPSDIYNELCIIFLELLEKFEFRGIVSFSYYITQYMRWDIKAWIVKLFKDPLNQSTTKSSAISQDILPFKECHETLHTNYAEQPEADLLQLPEMDIKWINDPCDSLFSILTKYERSLLYMSFKQGLGVREISRRLGRAKDTIHTHLQQAIDKLREEYNKTKEE